jgi:hypothetical protein
MRQVFFTGEAVSTLAGAVAVRLQRQRQAGDGEEKLKLIAAELISQVKRSTQ